MTERQWRAALWLTCLVIGFLLAWALTGGPQA